jgi:two-component system LytT family response regulator
MIHAVIIDDEANGLRSLELLIEKFVTGVRVVASTIDPYKGVELINNYRPDVVFLDIHMPNLDGFQLLEQLTFRAFHLIFTTAHREYALKAIKQSASGYLLKPVDLQDLEEVLEKVRHKMSGEKAQPDASELLQLLNAFQEAKVAVPSKTSIEYVSSADIAYIEAYSNYTVIVFADNRSVTAYKALKDYESQLCQRKGCFVRIHNSYIVNVNYVTRYLKEDGGYAVIQDRKSIPVSKSRKDAFLKLINFPEN